MSKRSKKNRRDRQKEKRHLERKADREAEAKAPVQPRDGPILTGPYIRSDCQRLKTLIQAGVFSTDQVDAMIRKMGVIVAQGDNRESIAAYKTILAQAKLAFDIERSEEPRRHEHLHAHIDAGGNRVLGIAERLGIEICIDGIGIDVGEPTELRNPSGRVRSEETGSSREVGKID